MAKVDTYVQGKCMDMCPLAEITMREKERMLHLLETESGTEHHKVPRANKRRMVKAFSRSAAGKQISADSLRPPTILLKTVKYLLYDVISCKKLPWYMVYEFITDRLMAVRQDMVVQHFPPDECIQILQPIVRFHAYAAYKMCDADIAHFDPVLNNKHLQECLKKLLHCYDSFEKAGNNCFVEKRPEFEALYLIFNLGNEEALCRTLSIPEKYKTNTVRKAMTISLCSKSGNFVRLCRLIGDLPPVLAAVAALHLPGIRKKALQTMCTAYHSKNLTFPLKILKQILLYGYDDELAQDCQYYDIKVEAGNVFFRKQAFNDKNQVLPRHEVFVDAKIVMKNVPSMVLNLI